MTIVSIHAAAGHVYKDGVHCHVDCSGIRDGENPSLKVHAVHWNGSAGWIEYVNDLFDTTNHAPNRPIKDVAQFQNFIDAWKAPNAATA